MSCLMARSGRKTFTSLAPGGCEEVGHRTDTVGCDCAAHPMRGTVRRLTVREVRLNPGKN
eukprot:scaffold65107_cov35-Prasinocladus_malaysianus.AAC.1